MAATVSDIIQIMDQLASPSLAEEWDNAGLQVGDRRWTVRNIGVALDPTAEVVDAACTMKVDLLITHHPLIFHPLNSIDIHSSVGAIIAKALRQRLAIFSAHTNLDKTEGGLNDILARRIGLKNLEILERSKEPEGNILKHKTHHDVFSSFSDDIRQGLGRIGRLQQATQLHRFALMIKKKLKLNSLKVAGRPDLIITIAAVCTGSGSSLLKHFFSSGAQVYISGDLRYHDARDIEAAGLGMIDIGHFPSEYLIVEELVTWLNKIFSENKMSVKAKVCGVEKDPFVVL